jgi:archaellum component FlaD/FlaE
MSEPITVDLGAVTAYADAVEQGYTGTREEFGELLANFAKRADEVKQDKEEVKQTKEEVFSKADSFDKHVEEEKNRVTEEFNSNAEQVLQTNKQEIGSAKSEALEEIENLKEDAVTQVDKTKTDGVQEITILTNEKKALLENTGTNQKNLVESEGTKQIQAVENKGTATLATIPEDYTALNTSVNDLNDLMHTKAPAIVEEATSGTEITVNDSADGMRLQGLNVYGKSWQVTTTGKNLSSIKSAQLSTNVVKSNIVPWTKKNKIYFSCDTENVENLKAFVMVRYYDENRELLGANGVLIPCDGTRKEESFAGTGAGSNGTKIDLTTVEYINLEVSLRTSSTSTPSIDNIMLCDEANQPYEPYTGGKPSPSPDYPQEIQSAGYVLSTGKNLLNADEYYSEFKQPDGTYKGKVVNINNVRISLSEFVGKKVTLSVKVKVATTTSSVYIAAYIGSEQKRINGSMITSGLTGKSILTITPALNTDYFIISYGSGNDDVTFSELQLELGSVATSYEPYTGGVPALYQKDIEVGVTGKNLFDINSLKFGYAVNTDTGAIASSSTSCISEYMQVDSDEKYILSGAPRTLYKIVAFYDENKKYLGRTSGGDFDSIKLEFDNYKDVKYIILSIYENINVQGKIADVKKSNIQIEKGSEATTYEPYKQPQSLQITTPIGLPAIPVPSSTSGITYTDADGQAWIADEIDFERGKYIQRVWQAEFDGSEDEVWRLYNTVVGVEGFSIQAFPENMSGRTGYSNQYTVYKTGDSSKGEGAWFGSSNRYIYLYKNRFFDVSLADKGLSNFKAHLAKHPLKVMTYLDNPIETDLSEEQIQAYKAVHSNKPTTIISNDAYAWMGASYAADTKLYIDNKVQEIASAVIASASEAE